MEFFLELKINTKKLKWKTWYIIFVLKISLFSGVIQKGAIKIWHSEIHYSMYDGTSLKRNKFRNPIKKHWFNQITCIASWHFLFLWWVKKLITSKNLLPRLIYVHRNPVSGQILSWLWRWIHLSASINYTAMTGSCTNHLPLVNHYYLQGVWFFIF